MATLTGTVRRLVEQTLTRSDTRRLVAQLPAVVWTTDLDFRVTSLAGAALATLSIEPDKCLGCSVTCLFQLPASSLKALDAHFLAAQGESCAFEAESAGRDFAARLDPLRDGAGTIVGVIGIALDSTDEIVRHRGLRISEQNYRSLIEDAPHAICRATPGGDLLQVNRAMQEMLGYSEPDLLLRNLRTQIFADQEQYAAFLNNLREQKSWHGFEARWLRRDSQLIHVNLSGRAVWDGAGEISCLDLFAENISEHKKLEEQLRQAQKMQAVGQLAGGIAHDFNNLLTVIRGQTEMIAEHILTGDALVSRLREIERAADRAITLTRQLLAFSRLQVLETRVLNLNTIVASVHQMLARLIGENIEVSFVGQPDLWPVRVDRGQIELVLINLALNARDAMPEGGRLTIETRNITCHEVRNNAGVDFRDSVRLSVRDTGHGMDEAVKARIFEPFFTTKPVGRGTGLGLSVVYGVIQQSSGWLRVESRPGVGSDFQIFLPRVQGSEERTSETARARIPTGCETILVAEDDDGIRNLVAGFLRQYGYRVLTAKDGLDALELTSTASIEVLLTDLVMPKMGGRELAERLREKLPGLKVILMSGHAEHCGLHADGACFLQKPFSMLALATAIRDAVSPQPSRPAMS